jgi:D-alanyl-D-alanine carboxypeptidase
LTANGIDWMSLPKANSSDAHFMEATGQTVAPEFWAYWSSHGLDFGDEGVSFRESLALFGYPVTPTQVETNADGDTVLTQWFERARFELHEDGTVLLGRLGAEVNDSSAGFAIRVRTELEAAFRVAFESSESEGMLAGLSSPRLGDWVFTSGVADPADGVPYTSGTYQRIGSVTKTFTTTLILQLADQGLLGLDDTIDQWFDGVTYGDRITVRMLANMTSGIASYTEDEQFVQTFYADPHRIWQPQELVDYAISLPPSFEPGTGWEYSNSNTVMLGLIIEAVTGEDVRVVLQEQILDPLGLVHTSFPANDDDSIPAPYARGRTTQGQPEGHIADATNWNPSWGWTAGQMISTFDDLLIWARALGSGALLSEEAFAVRTDWVTLPPNTPESAYGFGVGFINGWIGHDGSLPGYNALVAYRPDVETAMVVVTNSDIKAANGQAPVTGVVNSWAEIINREYPLPTAEE